MADITTNEADESRSIAQHEFIATAGGEKVSIEQAVGIRYIDRASGSKFEWIIPDAKAGSPQTMLALFGSKTKATNETSRVRQRLNGPQTAAEPQLEALDEVFESISNGVWREKAEGGGGSRTDKGVLADVLIEMLGTTAKGDRAHYVKRFEDDVAYMRKVLASDAGTKYRERMGKKGPAVDTLA